jgi:DNA-binding NtrC family response regulator
MAKLQQILLVDSDPFFRNHFQRMLKSDFEIEVATNAEEMWEKIKYNADYALVVVELVPKGQTTTGKRLVLISELTRRYPLLPVVAISQDDSAIAVLQALQQGAKTFVAKQNNSVSEWLYELRRVQRKPVKIIADESGDKKHNLLLVDDDPRFHTDFKMAFRKKYSIEYVLNAEKMWEVLQEKAATIDLIALDMMLDGKDISTGLNLIPELKEKYAELPVIAITADDNIKTAVDAMKRGAKSFLPKNDIDFEHWDSQFQEAIKDSTAQETIQQKDKEIDRLKKGEVANKHPFIAEAPRMLELKATLEYFAQKPGIALLLTGETGVGKEIAARYYHSCSPRKDKPFVSVNLSAISKSLLESELFGVMKGAFTGAIEDKIGYFQKANGGVLMLDEFADIDSDIQVKLLRFLQERTVNPVGSTNEIEVDVQIILATNKNLYSEVQKGNFRDDLRNRIGFTSEIPPLRERTEDILPILDYYLLHKHGTSTAQILVPDVLRAIYDYAWPGNIRQLCNTIDNMMFWRDLRKKDKVDLDCYEEGLKSASSGMGTAAPAEALAVPAVGYVGVSMIGNKRSKAVSDMQKIEGMLGKTGNSKAEIAIMLGYKGTDHMRARIRTCYGNFPEIFAQFPRIREKFTL